MLQNQLDAARVAMAGVLAERASAPPPSPPADTAPTDPGTAPEPPQPVFDPSDTATREAARLARALADLPHVKDAFAAGRLRQEQAVALARLATDPTLVDAFREDERALVDDVVRAGPDRSAAILSDWKSRVSATRAGRDAQTRRRKRSMRTWRDSEGFSHVHMSAADEADARVQALVRTLVTAYDRIGPASNDEERRPDERTREQFGFDAVSWGLEHAASAIVADGTAPSATAVRPKTTMVVKVEYDDLVGGGPGVDVASGATISPDDIRRRMCTAGISRLVMQGDSIPLDRGRETRFATPAQRQALSTMFDTCVGPVCSMPFGWTDIHHIDEFVADLGETNIDDLVPACDGCHHDLHGAGHAIERGDRRGEKFWVTPDGLCYPIGCRSPKPRHRRPPPGRPASSRRRAAGGRGPGVRQPTRCWSPAQVVMRARRSKESRSLMTIDWSENVHNVSPMTAERWAYS